MDIPIIPRPDNLCFQLLSPFVDINARFLEYSPVSINLSSQYHCSVKDIHRLGTTNDFILQSLSPAELFKISLTTSVCQDAVAAFLKCTYWLDLFLLPFFTVAQYLQFQRLQGETGALISGSVALQFFDRTHYGTSDLDIYVNHHYILVVHEFLLSAGYTYQEEDLEPFDKVKNCLDGVFALTLSFGMSGRSASYSG